MTASDAPSKAPAKTATELDHEKRLAAEAALMWVHSGMTIGLGSGSTAAYFIQSLSKRISKGALKIEAVASSHVSEAAARAAGIPLTTPRRGLRLDITIDGADEITPELDLIKGRGGALLREKVLVQAARYFLVIADSSKRIAQFGAGPVPVEVVPFALPWVADRIQHLGGRPTLRMDAKSPDKPYLTDQQNHILDCRFERWETASQAPARDKDPRALAAQLEKIAGVAAHGIFTDCANAALIADGSEVSVVQPGRTPIRLADFPLPSL
jgi:ribose 5-phosphate isomerase A